MRPRFPSEEDYKELKILTIVATVIVVIGLIAIVLLYKGVMI